MKLVVTIEGTETILNVDVSDDISLEDFKAYLEAETDIKPEHQQIMFNSQELTDPKSDLAQSGVGNDDLLVLRSNAPAPAPAPGPAAGQQSDEQIEAERQTLLRDPVIGQAAGNPQLSSILNDSQRFRDFIRSAQGARNGSNGAGGAFGSLGTEPLYQQEIARLRALPDTADNRRKIEELEDLQNIEENRLLAYEMAPETFTQVPMLYINMEVNKVAVTAFVDTGAQMTIMSPRLAEKCGLHRLIDRRFRGEARGVGSGAILGRIHSAPVKIEDAFIPCSFVILDSGVDLILGLDMLRRHQANVNLKDMSLYISDVKTKFLSEGEVQNDFFASLQQQRQQPANIFGDGTFAGPGNQLGSASDAKKPRLDPGSSAAGDAARAAATRASQPRASADVDPAKIDQLTALGFSKDQARTALAQCAGNVDMAASLLFQ